MPCYSITLLPLTTILAVVRRQSTSLITGVSATFGFVRTVNILQIRLHGERSSPHFILHIPLHVLSLFRQQTPIPFLAVSAPNVLFWFTFNLEMFECQQALHTISTCTPSGPIGLADECSYLLSIPSSTSCMDQTGLMADVIVTVRGVTFHGWGIHQHILLSYQGHLYSGRLQGTVLVRFLSRALSFPPHCSLHQRPVPPWVR